MSRTPTFLPFWNSIRCFHFQFVSKRKSKTNHNIYFLKLWPMCSYSDRQTWMRMGELAFDNNIGPAIDDDVFDESWCEFSLCFITYVKLNAWGLYLWKKYFITYYWAFPRLLMLYNNCISYINYLCILIVEVIRPLLTFNKHFLWWDAQYWITYCCDLFSTLPERDW